MNILHLMALTTCPAQAETLFLQAPAWDADVWGFPKIRGTILGVPIIRTIVVWGIYWGSLILGNYRVCQVTIHAGLQA